ncbi:Sequestosome-1 [Paramecium bursaria]
MRKIKNVQVRYGEKKEVSLGDTIQEFITNIAVAFEYIPKDYVLKYSEIPGKQLTIGCRNSYDDFTNKLLSIGFKCNYIPTIYLNKCQSLSSEIEIAIQIDKELIKQFDQLQINAKEEGIQNGKKCDDCYSLVNQYFRCLDCLDYCLCQECFKILDEKQHFQDHQFIFISKPSTWQNVKRDAIQLIQKLKQKSKNYQDGQTLVHYQIQCDGCNQFPILQYRYKCLECEDYDLCNECFMDKLRHQQHISVRLDKPIQFQTY